MNDTLGLVNDFFENVGYWRFLLHLWMNCLSWAVMFLTRVKVHAEAHDSLKEWQAGERILETKDRGWLFSLVGPDST